MKTHLNKWPRQKLIPTCFSSCKFLFLNTQPRKKKVLNVTYVWLDLQSNAGPNQSAEGRDLWCPKTPFHDCRCFVFFELLFTFPIFLLANLSLRYSCRKCLKPPSISSNLICCYLMVSVMNYSRQAFKNKLLETRTSHTGVYVCVCVCFFSVTTKLLIMISMLKESKLIDLSTKSMHVSNFTQR